jgi:hypothetical protein
MIMRWIRLMTNDDTIHTRFTVLNQSDLPVTMFGYHSIKED